MAAHTHEHAHNHRPLPDEDGPLGYYQTMEIAVRELLIEKGVFGADDVRAAVETMDARSPARGAEVVAHAWTDPAFKDALLADGSAACASMGIELGPLRLIAVENTATEHNVIVCTLCSCYPRNLLGIPPDWYKAKAYRARVVREPRAVLGEFGTEIADDVTVRVHDSAADMRYIVVPRRPAGTEGWERERLASLVTRDCMIGVTVPKTP